VQKYLFIRSIHCWDAFSLSQSVLNVGSQEVAWIWDRRPAPAGTPDPIPGGRDGGRAPGSVESSAWVSRPSPLSTAGLMVCGIPGAITDRPVSARGGGDADECPGPELPKLAENCAPWPCTDPTEPLAFSSPTLSAIVDESEAATNCLISCQISQFLLRFLFLLARRQVEEGRKREMTPTYSPVSLYRSQL